MEIENTGWKSFAEENKIFGGLTFGYKAPATGKALQGLPKTSVMIEVRDSDGSFYRLVDMKNAHQEKFAEGQWLAVMDSRPLVGHVNENFKAFENALTEKAGKPLPDNRFDKFVDWSNPRSWQKQNGGYSLDISHLSSEKKEELTADFIAYHASVKNGQLSVVNPHWVKVLEFEWQMAEKQRLAYARERHTSSR